MAQALDAITLARDYIDDPSSQGRWTTPSMLRFTTNVQWAMVRYLQWPLSRYSATTNAGQQEYSGLPAFINIQSVYVNGQLIIRTDIPTLESHQDEGYDQGFGTMPGAQYPGSGGPPGTSGTYTPAWNIQAPEVYPVANTWGLPAPRAEPWFAGQRPRYYFRGGVIGFVPAPAGAATFCIDAVIPPPPLKDLTDALLFDDSWVECIAWGITEQCSFSDDSDRAEKKYMLAHNMYTSKLKELKGMLMGFDGDDSRLPKFLTLRSFYQKGNNRNPGPWTEYP